MTTKQLIKNGKDLIRKGRKTNAKYPEINKLVKNGETEHQQIPRRANYQTILT